MNKPKFFLLNGPPYCGKDSLANAVVSTDRNSFVKASFVFPIKEATKAFFGLTMDEVKYLESAPQIKDATQADFFGRSWRQVNIDFAEKFAKLIYGKEFAGELLAKRVVKQFSHTTVMPNIIISDCGFNEEIQPLIKEFGAENVKVIKIARPGSDYSKDSRNYVNSESMPGVETYYLRNNKKDIKTYISNGWQLIQMIKNGQKPITEKF